MWAGFGVVLIAGILNGGLACAIYRKKTRLVRNTICDDQLT